MTDHTKAIIEALGEHGENGSGLISLSLKTGISQESLRKFFKENKEYCLPIEKYKFKLNRSAVENGSVEEIIKAIGREKAERKIKERVFKGFTWGFALGVFLPEFLPYLFKWIF
ncbi:hypothetical protein DRW07_14805 [Alteromonas sediminis]|uniref:Uncharacterized protein n=1 Tax=Alteromonas sediminis TaxID=2259342 RepID=A0A3N5XY46_9ALTE|nr:hypothetical protein [Alteromonas sediminis]RPJ66067.1 hypothetical protein DRW07_14805 [Alteromonas sediminis]